MHGPDQTLSPAARQMETPHLDLQNTANLPDEKRIKCQWNQIRQHRARSE